MDTLDKIEDTLARPAYDPSAETYEADTYESGAAYHDEASEADLAAEIVDKVETVSRKIDWMKIAGYAAFAAAGALGGYAYCKAQQQKPKTRIERLRDKLGLDSVDMSRLPASLRDIDFNRVRKTGRDVGLYAKKATHASAKKVAELTR